LATGADKTVRPAKLAQIFATAIFAREPPLQFQDRPRKILHHSRTLYLGVGGVKWIALPFVQYLFLDTPDFATEGSEAGHKKTRKLEPPSSPRTPRGEWPRRGTEGTKSGATEAAELARVKAEGGRALFLSDFTSEDIETTECYV
jgi:hypothetical protein